jgi:hypothetical protein
VFGFVAGFKWGFPSCLRGPLGLSPTSVSKEGVWTVQKIVTEHNHYLGSPNKSHKLKSQ